MKEMKENGKNEIKWRWMIEDERKNEGNEGKWRKN